MKLKVIIEQGNDTDNLDMSFLPKSWDVEVLLLTPDTYVSIISSFPKDCVVINLCDGIEELGQLGECVIKELERNKLPYTGSSVKSYKCKKSDIKIPGVQTPNSVVIKNKNYTSNSFNSLHYPVIIKPEYSSGSDGITLESKSCDLDDLLLKLAEYSHENIVVEEFIEGREFTVLACDNFDDSKTPLVLEPIECVFAKGYSFKHYDLKWKDYNVLKYELVNDDMIRDNIVSIAKDTFVKMNLDGYIRYDIRMDIDGRLYVIDVNPYPAIFYPKGLEGCADFILLNSKIMNNVAFVEHNIKCAIERAKTYQ